MVNLIGKGFYSGARPGLVTLLAFMLLAGSGPLPGVENDIRRDAAVIATELAMPSVVNIATETVIEYHDFYEDLLRQFYGWQMAPRQQKSISLGSGVIIDEEGYVLTNFHVVRRATRIQVKLWDDREYEADQLVNTQTSDLALLKLRDKPGEKFKAIKLAADDDLLLGETVLAIGNPFGLGGSVSKGILSSKNRRPATGNEPLSVEDWLQTDAAINPGNSGGPLVNLRGELIGVNVAVYREEHGERGMGVGFSIPVKQISAALSRLFTPEMTDSLWFGAQFKATPGPLVVASVQAGSPAARAGLREGDQVLQVNGRAPKGLIALNRSLSAVSTNEIHLALNRHGEQKSAVLRLVPFQEVVRQKLGFTLRELTQTAAQAFGVKPGEGLLVEEVEKLGPAERAQLRRGYLLAAIDGQAASDLRNVGQTLLGKKTGEPVQLTVVVPRRLGLGYVEFRQGTVDVQVR